MATEPNKEPYFALDECRCGRECHTLIFSLYNPILTEVPDEEKAELGELCAYVQFPMANAKARVDEIRRLCAKQGVKVG